MVIINDISEFKYDGNLVKEFHDIIIGNGVGEYKINRSRQLLPDWFNIFYKLNKVFNSRYYYDYDNYDMNNTIVTDKCTKSVVVSEKNILDDNDAINNLVSIQMERLYPTYFYKLFKSGANSNYKNFPFIFIVLFENPIDNVTYKFFMNFIFYTVAIAKKIIIDDNICKYFCDEYDDMVSEFNDNYLVYYVDQVITTKDRINDIIKVLDKYDIDHSIDYNYDILSDKIYSHVVNKFFYNYV
jgi:hypothetical protein